VVPVRYDVFVLESAKGDASNALPLRGRWGRSVDVALVVDGHVPRRDLVERPHTDLPCFRVYTVFWRFTLDDPWGSGATLYCFTGKWNTLGSSDTHS
jgi:hypothetical protein